jgi:hypothetical protein
MTLNPGGMTSPMAAATPQGQGYDTRSILFLPAPNDDLTSSFIELGGPNPRRATVAVLQGHYFGW